MDNTLALLLDAYGFISGRARALGADVFDTRLLMRKTTCVTGAEAARVFYDPDRFVRRKAAPHRLTVTLFGKGGVQSTDGATHAARKAMFMSFMTPASRERLSELARDRWREYIRRWEGMPRVNLFDESSRLICEAVFDWAGVPLPARLVDPMTERLKSMIEAPAAVGPRYVRGRLGRIRAEQSLGELIRLVRRRPPEATILSTIAHYRDPDGSLLDPRVAAVELLNVLRPTVAVGRYVVFTALALHAHPEHRERIRGGDEEFTEHFVQEVRRFYPFFPLVAARVARPFEWRGHRFPAGRRVLLDLQGVNHDPRLWDRPGEFRPERFAEGDWDGSAYTFVPQGGGDHYRDHRCPGEWITIDLMKTAARALTREMTYHVPPQDLRMSSSYAPAIPRSRFVIDHVRAAG
ncbi:cytochrome P450 [Bailinhaonella thermotolerans]|uniref:Cytochrome P450 n=2 Tax=Bailinhaonella thermotolerans TaxID=1070861 RepID=A0A3A4AX59_9ACTN|nr:cytochrome P450 [Bailinhaonella thermotolerans]